VSALLLPAPTERTGRLRTFLRTDLLRAASSAACLLLVLFAVGGSLLTRWTPDAIDIGDANAGPSANHWLGTDSLGRDLFARIAAGARISMFAPAAIVIIAAVLAVAIALACAWHGGWIDMAAGRLMDILFAFPSLLFAVLAVAVFGTGLVAPVAALAIAYVPYLGRVLRAVAVRERHQPYVEACVLAEMPGWQICLRHLLPALIPYVRAQATVAFGYAILDLAGISFIGLGVQPPTADWGVMVSEGRQSLLNGFPLEALTAVTFIAITVIAFNVLGDRLAAQAEQGI
jgi:peptide/nickel transport system permease protein